LVVVPAAFCAGGLHEVQSNASRDSHGTLAANLLGAFIIGAGLAWFNRLTNIDPMWKLLITTGFCGGLTTFSTFSSEVVFLLQQGVSAGRC
jgi:protein CrcB